MPESFTPSSLEKRKEEIVFFGNPENNISQQGLLHCIREEMVSGSVGRRVVFTVYFETLHPPNSGYMQLGHRKGKILNLNHIGGGDKLSHAT